MCDSSMHKFTKWWLFKFF